MLKYKLFFHWTVFLKCCSNSIKDNFLFYWYTLKTCIIHLEIDIYSRYSFKKVQRRVSHSEKTSILIRNHTHIHTHTSLKKYISFSRRCNRSETQGKNGRRDEAKRNNGENIGNDSSGAKIANEADESRTRVERNIGKLAARQDKTFHKTDIDSVLPRRHADVNRECCLRRGRSSAGAYKGERKKYAFPYCTSAVRSRPFVSESPVPFSPLFGRIRCILLSHKSLCAI